MFNINLSTFSVLLFFLCNSAVGYAAESSSENPNIGGGDYIIGPDYIVDPDLKEFNNIELSCGNSKVKILRPDWIS